MNPVSRIPYHASCILHLLLLSLLLFSCGQQNDREETRPNLLLISVDTLRADRLGCYGYDRPTSATIDRLAEEGVLFENAFATSPKTTPSHMSIMTGLYPRAHNVYMWAHDETGNYSGKTLSQNIPTLAEILKENGYTCAAFTGGANVAAKIGFGRGFEIYDEESDTVAAVSWLRENDNRPFFLFYHTYYTHSPYLPPPPYDTKYDPDYSGRIPTRKELMGELGMAEGESWMGIWEAFHKSFWARVDINDPEDRDHLNALYDGSIEYVDSTFINKLIETLKARDILDKTLVVFTSDHGEEFYEHGRLEHESIYREVAQVPLIMRLPARLPAGKSIGQLVRSIDIMPTILALLGISLETPIQGEDLLPAITAGRELGLVAHADFNDYGPRVVESVRSGPWFFLMDQRDIPAGEERRRPLPRFFKLFHTGDDPGERRDLSGDHPEVVAELGTRLREVRIESSKKHAEEGGEQKAGAMDRWDVERLKALGYF